MPAIQGSILEYFTGPAGKVLAPGLGSVTNFEDCKWFYLSYIQVFQPDFSMSFDHEMSQQTSLSMSVEEETAQQPKEKWQKRRTMYKVRVSVDYFHGVI